MGNKASQTPIESGAQSHERLGVIKVFQIPTKIQDDNPYRIQIRKQLSSEKKYEQWLKNLRSIESDELRDIVYLPQTFKYEKTGLCGSSGITQLSFEHFPFVLKSQIKNRRKMSQFFEQSQIWYLLYNLIEIGSIFQKKNLKIGDIHPRNCLLSQNGQMKLISTYSLPQESNNYDKIIESTTNDVYLAPQQIDPLLIDKGIYPNVDPIKAEIYSIGMTLLEAATLEDCYYAYNRGPLKVNKKKLLQLYEQIAQRYGTYLCQILTNMLEDQPKRRNKCSEVFQRLNPYEQAILNLQPFELSGQTGSNDRSRYSNFANLSNANVSNMNVNGNGNMNMMAPKQNTSVYIPSVTGTTQQRILPGVVGYNNSPSYKSMNQNQGNFNNSNYPQRSNHGTANVSFSNTSIDRNMRRDF